jgi:hypothetical protein
MERRHLAGPGAGGTPALHKDFGVWTVFVMEM